MSNEIIKMFDYIGEKIGIVIDWTSTNVLPQVMDIFRRYCLYRIIDQCLLLMLLCSVLIVLFVLWRRSIKAYRTCLKDEENNFWWSYSFYNKSASMSGTIWLTVASAFVGTLSVIGILGTIGEIAEWLLVPEIKFLEVFSNYLG